MISAHAWAKNVLNAILVARTASCRVTKCVFHQTEANLAMFQLQNHQNVKKNQFWQKVPGVNGLTYETKSAPFSHLSNLINVFVSKCISKLLRNKETLQFCLPHQATAHIL